MEVLGKQLVKEIKKYASKYSEKDITWVLGKLAVEKEVGINTVSKFTKRTKEETEIFLGKFLQIASFPARFRGDKFVLLGEIYFQTDKEKIKRLSKKDKEFLGYLAGREIFKPKEFSWVFNITQKEAEYRFYSYIVSGLLDTKRVLGEIKVKLKAYGKELSHEQITGHDLQIVGICQMLVETTPERVSELTRISVSSIMKRLFYLTYHNAINVKYDIRTKRLRGKIFIIELSGFTIRFPRRSVSILEEDEKLVVGLILMMTKVSVKKIASTIEIEEEKVLKIAAKLTAIHIVPIGLDEKENLFFTQPIDFQPYRPLEQLQRLSLFNYNVLIGLLVTYKEINLKDLAKRLKEPAFEVLRALVNLVLEGYVVCTMDGNYNIKLLEFRSFRGAGEHVIKKWEAVIIGALKSKGEIEISEIASLLNVTKRVALEKAYIIVATGLVPAIVKNEKTLVAISEIHIPQTITPPELETTEKEVLGYLLIAEKPEWKFIEQFWKIGRAAARKVVYELSGYGLLDIKDTGKRIEIKWIINPTPERQIEELGEKAVMLFESLKKAPPVNTIQDIARKVGFSTQETLRLLFELSSEGFLKAELGRSVISIKTLKKAPVIPTCLKCGARLEDPRQPCPNCGAPPVTCSVCRGPIAPGDNIAKCPSCGHFAHEVHLKEWLKIKGECPVCRTKLSIEDLLLE